MTKNVRALAQPAVLLATVVALTEALGPIPGVSSTDGAPAAAAAGVCLAPGAELPWALPKSGPGRAWLRLRRLAGRAISKAKGPQLYLWATSSGAGAGGGARPASSTLTISGLPAALASSWQ